MSVSALPFDGASKLEPPQRQRAVGRVAFEALALNGRTRPMRIEESGSLRIRLPRGEGAGLDAVLVNTAGGIACGDRFSVGIEARAGTAVTVATPAAEKIYRSDGALAEFAATLTLGAKARLDWLPQETVLFDAARECLLPTDGCEAAMSAWNGLLAVRFCAVTVEALRAAAIPFLLAFRGEPLPRVWLS